MTQSNHKSAQSNKADTNDIGLKIVDILDNAGVKEDYPDFKDLSKTHSPRAEAKQAIQNLIAQEANKAVLAELETILKNCPMPTLSYEDIEARIAQLTSDKEEKP